MKTLLLKPKTTSLVANGFSALIAIASFSILTRLFDSEELAYWTFFLSLSALYTSLNQGLRDQFFIKRWNELRITSERSELIGSAWRSTIIVLTLAIITLVILFIIIDFFTDNTFYNELIIMLILFVLFDTPYRMALCKLKANMEFGKILRYKIFVEVLFFSVIISLFYLNTIGEEFTEIYWSVGASYLIIRIIISLVAINLGDSGIQKYKYGTKYGRNEMIDFGRFALGTQLVSSFLADSDFYLVHGIRGAALSSVFVVAKRCLPIIILATNSLAEVSYIKIATVWGSDKSKIRREFHRELGVLTLLMWPICALTFVLADEIIILIGGSEYEQSVPVFRAMVVCMFLLPIDKMIGIGLNSFNMPNKNFEKMIVILTVNIFGDLLILYMGGGLIGVAYITVLALLMGILYGYLFMRKVLKISFYYALKEGVELLWSKRREPAN